MPGKKFGEGVREARERRALLQPGESHAPAGHAGVYLHTRYVSRNKQRVYDTGSGFSHETIRREAATYTDVHVVDERGWPIEGGTTTIRHWKVVPDAIREQRTLDAIDEAFERARSYGEVMGVPVDASQTYSYFDLANRNDR